MIEPRWYQAEAEAAFWDHMCRRSTNPVICLPTGAGKSIVIAQIAKTAVERWNGRIVFLAHRKELLTQNATKIQQLLPDHKIGVYSAGLKSRDTREAILVAGIQSVYKRAATLGPRNLVFIDEVHLVPHNGEGMYRTFLESLREHNPKIRLGGCTATPYRLDVGPLCRPDGLFQKVCYSAPIRQLIDEGWLCNLTIKPANREVDTSRLGLRGGEFIPYDMQALFNSVVDMATEELVRKTKDRHSVLIFCSGIDHAEHVSRAIERLTDEPVGVVTGETLPLERASTLDRFSKQQLRYLCNVDVLTTGFDAPCIDAIVLLRATMSPGLLAQMIGRGFRVHESKEDCLILDFGGNLQRHGPIDAENYGKTHAGSQHAGEAPVKVCPCCGEEVLLGTRECPCGWLFPPREPSHDGKADEHAQVLAAPEEWCVGEVSYHYHTKTKDPNGTPTLRADYYCQPADGEGGNLEGKTISEWVCLEHEGYARRKAVKWWKQRTLAEVPDTIEDALALCNSGALAAPHTLTTIKDGKWYRITKAELDAKPEEWGAELDEWDEIPF